MNWYLDTGENSDIVTSTRIRFARNLSNYRFNRKMTINEAVLFSAGEGKIMRRSIATFCALLIASSLKKAP